MKISVNGKLIEVANGMTVEGLLGLLKIRRQYTAVALNSEVARKAEYAETVLREGDRVEIVQPMGGG